MSFWYRLFYELLPKKSFPIQKSPAFAAKMQASILKSVITMPLYLLYVNQNLMSINENIALL